MRRKHGLVPVYRDGTRIYKTLLPVLIDDDGERYVTLADALAWEAEHRRFEASLHASSRLPRSSRRMFRAAASGVSASATVTATSAGTALPVAVVVG